MVRLLVYLVVAADVDEYDFVFELNIDSPNIACYRESASTLHITCQWMVIQWDSTLTFD
jgi:hypothetical protein